MRNNLQMTFDFMNESHQAGKSSVHKKAHLPEETNSKDMRRFVMGWLLSLKPSGLGYDVSTRIVKYKAGIAAFWSKTETKKGKRTLIPYQTAIIEIRTDKDQAISEYGNNSDLNTVLAKEKKNKIKLEAEIRKEEPELKLSDNLFSDIESWEYRKSKNQPYHKCCANIERLERSLNKGSRFERIRQSLLADYLYLAVPRGLIEPQELADGWGLLYINDDKTVDVIKCPENWNCPLENRFHLIQNIAKSNLQPLCFANGISLNKNNLPKFVRIPRKRKK